MITVATDPRQAYLDELLATLQQDVPEVLALPELRQAAAAMVKEQGFPTRHQESWRFTDISPLLNLPLAAAAIPAMDMAALEPVLLPEAARLVLVNGVFNAELSDLSALPEGLVAGSIAQLWAGSEVPSQLSPYLAQQSGGHEVFTALNTAGFQDGAVVWVPANVALEFPVHIINLSLPQAAAAAVQPRVLVVAGCHSQLTLIEEFWGSRNDDHLTNAVAELWLEPGAQVHHSRVQREGPGTFHIGKTAVSQAQDSRYHHVAVSVGARFSRHSLEVYQRGPQTHTQLQGLVAIATSQLADTQSLVALDHPHGTVDQAHKAIVDDRAHSVFSGKIVVPQSAQLTSASQLNRNLLLSDRGRIDTKPQLEIVADNVKCAHGATVSQLQPSEIFYLQSRGISADQAQRLLIAAFAAEILQQLPMAALQDRLTACIGRFAQPA